MAEGLREAAGLRETSAELQRQVEAVQAELKSATDREHWQAQDLARSRDQVTSLQQQVCSQSLARQHLSQGEPGSAALVIAELQLGDDAVKADLDCRKCIRPDQQGAPVSKELCHLCRHQSPYCQD